MSMKKKIVIHIFISKVEGALVIQKFVETAYLNLNYNRP